LAVRRKTDAYWETRLREHAAASGSQTPSELNSTRMKNSASASDAPSYGDDSFVPWRSGPRANDRDARASFWGVAAIASTATSIFAFGIGWAIDASSDDLFAGIEFAALSLIAWLSALITGIPAALSGRSRNRRYGRMALAYVGLTVVALILIAVFG
jgi:hypothetical protein